MPRRVLSVVVVLALAGASSWQSRAEDAGAGQWDIDCGPKSCSMTKDAPSVSAAGSEADDYVTMSITFDRATQKMSSVTFQVTPMAEKKSGIMLMFGKTAPPRGTSWQSLFDDKATVLLPFEKCDQTSCIAHASGTVTNREGGKLDLAEKLGTESNLVLGYTEKGTLRTFMDPLAPFVRDRKSLLAQLAKPN